MFDKFMNNVIEWQDVLDIPVAGCLTVLILVGMLLSVKWLYVIVMIFSVIYLTLSLISFCWLLVKIWDNK
jgi:hypothetical protein